ncbi:MAG: RNA polymerase sigma factor SigM [Mycobacteriales bacterium]
MSTATGSSGSPGCPRCQAASRRAWPRSPSPGECRARLPARTAPGGPALNLTTDVDDIDDATLLRRHVSGDAAAFGVLVARHRDRAWAVALRTLGDASEAEDAVQDAFLSAYRQAERFRGDAQFSTWLHRIVVNACLDRMRRRRVRPVVPYDADALAAIADPRDDIAQRETVVEVTDALARLSDDQRIAIILVDLHGLSVDEAAAVLDVPAGTVKSRCHRGRAQLAVLLGHLRPERLQTNSAVPGTSSLPPTSN